MSEQSGLFEASHRNSAWRRLPSLLLRGVADLSVCRSGRTGRRSERALLERHWRAPRAESTLQRASFRRGLARPAPTLRLSRRRHAQSDRAAGRHLRDVGAQPPLAVVGMVVFADCAGRLDGPECAVLAGTFPGRCSSTRARSAGPRAGGAPATRARFCDQPEASRRVFVSPTDRSAAPASLVAAAPLRPTAAR